MSIRYPKWNNLTQDFGTWDATLQTFVDEDSVKVAVEKALFEDEDTNPGVKISDKGSNMSGYYRNGVFVPEDNDARDHWNIRRQHRDELTEEEVLAAKPIHFPNRLLDKIVGMHFSEAEKIIKVAGYESRVVWDDTKKVFYTPSLKRNRVNLLCEEGIIYEAFVG